MLHRSLTVSDLGRLHNVRLPQVATAMGLKRATLLSSVTKKNYYAFCRAQLKRLWHKQKHDHEFRRKLQDRMLLSVRALPRLHIDGTPWADAAASLEDATIRIDQADLDRLFERFHVQTSAQLQPSGFRQWLVSKGAQVRHVVGLGNERGANRCIGQLLSPMRSSDGLLSALYSLWMQGRPEHEPSTFIARLAAHRATALPSHPALLNVTLNANKSVDLLLLPDHDLSDSAKAVTWYAHVQALVNFIRAEPSIRWFQIGLTQRVESRMGDHISLDGASGKSWDGMVVCFKCASVEAAKILEAGLIKQYYWDAKNTNEESAAGVGRGDGDCWIYVVYSRATEAPNHGPHTAARRAAKQARAVSVAIAAAAAAGIELELRSGQLVSPAASASHAAVSHRAATATTSSSSDGVQPMELDNEAFASRPRLPSSHPIPTLSSRVDAPAAAAASVAAVPSSAEPRTAQASDGASAMNDAVNAVETGTITAVGVLAPESTPTVAAAAVADGSTPTRLLPSSTPMSAGDAAPMAPGVDLPSPIALSHAEPPVAEVAAASDPAASAASSATVTAVVVTSSAAQLSPTFASELAHSSGVVQQPDAVVAAASVSSPRREIVNHQSTVPSNAATSASGGPSSLQLSSTVAPSSGSSAVPRPSSHGQKRKRSSFGLAQDPVDVEAEESPATEASDPQQPAHAATAASSSSAMPAASSSIASFAALLLAPSGFEAASGTAIPPSLTSAQQPGIGSSEIAVSASACSSSAVAITGSVYPVPILPVCTADEIASALHPRPAVTDDRSLRFPPILLPLREQTDSERNIAAVHGRRHKRSRTEAPVLTPLGCDDAIDAQRAATAAATVEGTAGEIVASACASTAAFSAHHPTSQDPVPEGRARC